MRQARICTLVIWVLVTISAATAYDPESHQQIVERSASADLSSLDKVLLIQLGIENGIRAEFPGTIVGGSRTIQLLLGDGAKGEDSPDLRSLNHFHNPLVPWESAGLRAFGIPSGQAAVLWQQSATQGMGGQWAWQDARSRYFAALTAATKDQRDQAFALTFETLGHVAHLVQDMTVPAHVRNDPHPSYEGYEGWVMKRRELTGTVPFLGDAPAIPTVPFTATGHLQAPAPIARLMDADAYSGSSADVLAGTALGTAEYTNGNFLSGDTIFRDFAFPRQQSLEPHTVPVGSGTRIYYRKVGDGETIEYLVAEGTFLQKVVNSGLLQSAPAYVLDDRVYQGYAAKLIPRAVGYSTALLDYFFRGRLNFTVEPGKDVLGNDDPATRRLTVTNRSAETMYGQFFLYGDAEDSTRKQYPVMTTGQDTLVLASGEQSPPMPFIVPDALQTAGVQRYAVVFKGKLGQEDDAVAGAVNPVAGVFAIQEAAGFSTEPDQTDTGPQDSVTQYSHEIDQSWRIRGDPTRQRATGRFEAGGLQAPGKFIKAVRLQMQPPPDPGTNQVVLRLENAQHDTRVSENEWIRGGEDAFEPVRWTIDVDLSAVDLNGPLAACGPGLWYTCATVRLPRAMEVEMLDGTKLLTPLVWWRGADSSADAVAKCSVWPDVVCADANQSSMWKSDRTHAVSVFYGDGDPAGDDYRWVTCDGGYCRVPYPMTDPAFPHTSVGFVPIGTVGDLAIGTAIDEAHITPGNPYPDTEDPWWSSHGCSGAWTQTRARVFVAYSGYAGEEKKWDKHGTSISWENGENVVTRESVGTPACVLPALPTIGAPVLSDLQIRRDYLPQELTAFQALGITPPPHTITLKARPVTTP